MKSSIILISVLTPLFFSPTSYSQMDNSPQAFPSPSVGQIKFNSDKYWCHDLLGSGPDSALYSGKPGDKPFPRPTPMPDVHLVRGGKVVVFNNDNSVTVIREDGATSIGASNKCEKSDMNFGKYTAKRFVEMAKYVKAESRMPDEVKAKMSKWLIRYFDYCSKVYPDVETLRPMLADIESAANKGEKTGAPPRTAPVPSIGR